MKALVPDLAMVPRLFTRSALVMPIPESSMVKVLFACHIPSLRLAEMHAGTGLTYRRSYGFRVCMVRTTATERWRQQHVNGFALLYSQPAHDTMISLSSYYQVRKVYLNILERFYPFAHAQTHKNTDDTRPAVQATQVMHRRVALSAAEVVHIEHMIPSGSQ